jgi:signal transduction histidine kinase
MSFESTVGRAPGSWRGVMSASARPWTAPRLFCRPLSGPAGTEYDAPTHVRVHPMVHPSARAALVIGLLVTLALWLYTGYTFSRRLDDVEQQAADVAARYLRAQELLTTVRTQVLVASIRVRDALLNPDPASIDGYREQIAVNYASLDTALTAYVPVLGSDSEDADMTRLRAEVENFRDTVTSLLAHRVRPSTADVRELLNAHIVPRRESAIRISEEVQALNRAAFLRQQGDLATIHRTAERQSARRLALAMATSAGVLLLVTAYAGRLEHRLRAQLERDAALSRELQEAHARLVKAQEDERRTIARELHDEVGQVLTAVKFELGLAQRAICAHGLSPVPLIEAQNVTAAAINTVRDLSQLLHPVALDDLGLVAAVDVLLRGLARRQDIQVELTQSGLDERLDPATEVAAYRIVQEALTNVARHAQAGSCRVGLRRWGGKLVVDVVDDGVGFELQGPTAPPARLGLLGIRERAVQVGGDLLVTTQPGAGTRLHAELPVLTAAGRQASDG